MSPPNLVVSMYRLLTFPRWLKSRHLWSTRNKVRDIRLVTSLVYRIWNNIKLSPLASFCFHGLLLSTTRLNFESSAFVLRLVHARYCLKQYFITYIRFVWSFAILFALGSANRPRIWRTSRFSLTSVANPLIAGAGKWIHTLTIRVRPFSLSIDPN